MEDGYAIGSLQQVDDPRQFAARSGRECLSAFADNVRTRDVGRVRILPRSRRLACRDRLFRSLMTAMAFKAAVVSFSA
jgi:hypothetical protein